MLTASLLLILHLAVSNAELSPCELSADCHQCIGCGPRTAWCVSSKLARHEPRCGLRATLEKRGCPSGDIVSMESNVSVPLNVNFSDNPKDRVELRPQEVHVSLRVGEEVTIPVHYRKSGNYPVDVYILSDLSYSMKPYIKNIAFSAKAIAENMKEKTSAFRLGFGSFVDKPLYPFTYLEDSCGAASERVGASCRPTIGYEHNVNLTSDVALFTRILNNITGSQNADTLEGGLDAVLQAAVCPDVIGWDRTAEKMILYITNGGLHIGGDGVLAGIVRPAEKECFMGRRGPGKPMEYLKTTELDYPSVQQIKQALDEANIGIAFGTPSENNRQVYRNLAGVLSKASVAALPILDRDKSDPKIDVTAFVKLIRENYERISASVMLDFDSDNDNVQSSIESRCSRDGPWRGDDIKCAGVKLGDEIDYRIRVKAGSCLAAPATLRYSINEEQSLRVLVSTICECADCERRFLEPSAATCGSHGDWACGRCHCQRGRSGRHCECDAPTSNASCFHEGVLCSNRGLCSCGHCECLQRFNGARCECDPQACPKSARNDQVCGGRQRGRCRCDTTCECQRGFQGTACDCLEPQACVKPGDTRNCSGHGTCYCGSCICDDEWELKFCDGLRSSQGAPPTCTIAGLKECALCHRRRAEGDQDRTACRQECDRVAGYDVRVEVRDDIDEEDICLFDDDEEGCRVKAFTSWPDKFQVAPRVRLRVVVGRRCREQIYASASSLVAGVIGGIFLSGLIALAIWRVVAYFEDKSEYERLMMDEQAAMGVQSNINPLYKSPETVVYNPLHVDSRQDELTLAD